MMKMTAAPKSGPFSLEATIHEIGRQLFDGMEKAEKPALYSFRGLQGALMEWAMKDEAFKVQLFRFIDVLPALNSSAAVTRHLTEYLHPDRVRLNPALRSALAAGSLVGGLVGSGLQAQMTALARSFMLGHEDREIIRQLRRLNDRGTAFTVDVLGEAVVNEPEAEAYAARYGQLLDLLARETAAWPPNPSNVAPRGAVPTLTLSVKISALYSQIQAVDPETALEKISVRLRPLLRRAKEVGALIHFDMEQYSLKNLTLQLFRQIFSEPEFAEGPACGVVIQAYLTDSESDLRELLAWARIQRRRFAVRLVKGAYWDYETVIARQRGWPLPVFATKPETDANFEKLSLLLLENEEFVDIALASHNVRSFAHALAQAQRLGVDPRQIEFQVLYGMADPLVSALRRQNFRVREYCPVGQLLPGMAYFVRRLLENTSNEGFLANQFAKGADPTTLLRNPEELISQAPNHVPPVPQTAGLPDFRNEPPVDFTQKAEREAVREALREWHRQAGKQYPLVIENRPLATRDWTPSRNPAHQQEIIGYAACATTEEASTALAAARAAQPAWARRPVEERARLGRALARLLRRDKAPLTALMILEAGKSWTEADADVAEAIDFCEFYAAAAVELERPQRTQIVPGESNVLQWRPRGTGVVLAPWNFPLAILTGMAFAAVVTGNTVLVKPSEQTPIVAAQWMKLVLEAGFPPGVVNLVSGRGAEIGAWLTAHPQIDFIAFTGSREVGLQIAEAAGRWQPGQENLKKVICEMGGKNALIIDSDADLDEAVTACVASAFGYMGQKCSALSRLIVLADQAEKFTERLIAAAASLRVGPAEEAGTVVGPVIDRAAQQRILAVIEAGKTEARLAWQGTVPADPEACYVPPTIFAEVPRTSRLFQEEIFGPVLSITIAQTFDEALALANDSAFALTGGLFSRSPVHLERAKNELICGNLYLNRTITGAVVGRQPFGGFRLSGGGTKAGGRDYLQHFLVPRVITENCLRRGFGPTEECI
jgi:RHH-type proline utilization regulon transcriptional repressor/proline dehydrogenase/delta 1-pyrroline-5-carboxylate dehydrogenase